MAEIPAEEAVVTTNAVHNSAEHNENRALDEQERMADEEYKRMSVAWEQHKITHRLNYVVGSRA